MAAGFEDFVLRRGAALLRFALMLSGNRHTAEDLVQSVLTRAYPRWSRISSAEWPEAYLKSAIVNEHLSWWRRRASGEVPVAAHRERAGGVIGDSAAAQASRRRRLAVTASGIVTLAVLVGGVSLSGPHGGGSPPVGAIPSSPAVPAVPSEWRVESSNGIEISVPADWATNDFGCPMSDRSSVVWNGGSPALCYQEEPRTKEVAIIRTPQSLVKRGIPGRDVSLGGVPATRGDGRLDDGRYAGWIAVPSRQVAVEVRTRTEATTRMILDSARLVDIDHAGCPAIRPEPSATSDPAEGTEIPRDATAISICAYPGGYRRLETSAEVTGQDAARIAAALLAARPGGNPDVPANKCAEEHPVAPDVVLLVRAAGSPVTTVWVTYSTCTKRGIVYGTHHAQVTLTLIKLITGPLRTGYTHRGNLPE